MGEKKLKRKKKGEIEYNIMGIIIICYNVRSIAREQRILT